MASDNNGASQAEDNNYYGQLFSNISKTFSDRTSVARRLSLCKPDDEASDKAPTATTGQSIFSRTSSGLWGYSNIFSGISSRLEAALQPSTAATPPSGHRKSVKDRSVFGQPEVPVEKVQTRFRKELSRESLDTLDSGNSMASSRASMSELLGCEHDYVNNYRESAGSSVGIGSSLESSEAEEADDGTCYSRSESVRSVASNDSWTDSDDSQASCQHAKQFMQVFVDKIFDVG